MPEVQARWPRARELAWGVLLLAGLLLLFFLTPIARGEVLSPADLLLGWVPWNGQAPRGFTPANPLLSDYVFQIRPWRDFTAAALREGRLPLWNPQNYLGAPFLGNGQSAVFYPLNLPYLALDVRPAVLVWAILRLLVAGVASYLFARVIGLGVSGAAVTALTFTFSGFLVVWLLWAHVNVAPWLPALLLAIELLVRRPTGPRIALVALVVAVTLVGGHPGTIVHVLSAAIFYAAWRIAMPRGVAGDRSGAGPRAGAVVVAFALGAAIAAIQLVPLGEYVRLSAAVHDRLDVPPSLWPPPRPRWLAMVSLVCPYCLGSPLRGDLPLGAWLDVGNFNELSGGYVGLAALALAVSALALGAWRGVDRFFLALAILAFGLAYTIPPIVYIASVLPFRAIDNTRALLLLAFALAVLAGRGADLVVSAVGSRARGIRIAGSTLLGLGAAGLALVGAGAVVAGSHREAILELLRSLAGPHTAALSTHYERLIGFFARQGAERAALLAVTGLALIVAAGSSRAARWRTWVLPVIVVVDLWSFGRNYNPSIPPALDYPPHGAIEFVRTRPGLFRMLALDGGLPPNTNLVYGLSDLRGYDALETPAYRELLAATGDFRRAQRDFVTLYFSNFASPLIDLVNVKYLISGRELRHPKLRLVWEGGGARVYDNLQALPRAFVVHRARALADERDVARALADPGFDPRALVLLHGHVVPRAGPADPDAEARIVEYRPEHVVIEASSRHDGILVLSDAWFPGWQATVDGRPTPILQADLLLRAVALPAGRHRIVFRYAPTSVRIGAITSGVALVIVVALLAVAIVRRRRPGGAWR